MSMIYTDGDYSFVNNTIDSGFAFPNPVFRFDPHVERGTYSYDDLKQLVKDYGGYLRAADAFVSANEGATDRLSCGTFNSIFDLYFCDGYAAIVFRSDATIGKIHIGATPDSELPHFSFSDLTPDNYLATDFNKMLGRATSRNRWFALGNNFWQEIDIGEGLCALKGKYFCLQGQTLLAAFGVEATKMPWLYAPANKNAGSAIAQIYRGNAYVTDGKIRTSVPFNFMSHDFGNDGICFTSDLRLNTQVLREQLRTARDIKNLSAFKRACFPGWSNEDVSWSGRIQYVLPNGSDKANLETCGGVVYCLANGTNKVDLDVAILIDHPEKTLLENYNFIVNDSAMNEALNKAQMKYDETKLKAWFSAANTVHDNIVGVVNGAVLYARDVANEVFAGLGDEVRRVCEEEGISSNKFELRGAFTPEVENVTIDDVPSEAASDADVSKSYIRRLMAQYGHGQKYGGFDESGKLTGLVNSLDQLPEVKNAIKNAIKSKIQGSVLTPINASIRSLSQQLGNMTFDLDNTCTYAYKAFFRTKYNSPMRVWKGTFGNLKQSTRVRGVDAEMHDNKLTITFTLRSAIAKRVLYWERNEELDSKMLKDQIQALTEHTGWTCAYLTKTDEQVESYPAANKGGWWITFTTHRKISALFKYQRGPGLLWSSDPDYYHTYYHDWKITKTFNLSLGEAIPFSNVMAMESAGGENSEIESFMNNLNGAINILAIIEYAKVLADYEREFDQCQNACPLVVVRGYFTTPGICNQFFNSVFSSPAATTEAIVQIRALAAQSDYQEYSDKLTTAANILERLNAQYLASAGDQVDPIHWIAKDKLSNLAYVEDPDVAAIALWTLREEKLD